MKPEATGTAGAVPVVQVLDVPLHVVTHAQALAQMLDWAHAGASARVNFVNVHGLITQRSQAAYASALQVDGGQAPSPSGLLSEGAAPQQQNPPKLLNLADGAPVAWMMRRLGHPQQQRLSGPDMMEALLAAAADDALPVYLLGGTPEVLARLLQALHQRWPGLQLVGSASPPFRALTVEEETGLVGDIGRSGARIVLVGLGCPKQEVWMARQQARLPALMLGVGAAFDFHAGSLARAPHWMRSNGLEWLHRLLQEPRRLGPRYLVTNSRFVVAAAGQLLRHGWRSAMRRKPRAPQA